MILPIKQLSQFSRSNQDLLAAHRKIQELQERIKRLEDIIEKASKHFRSAGPNACTAHEMANVLKEAKP